MVKGNIIKHITVATARTVNILFHPVLMPVYLFTILLFSSSLLANNSTEAKLSIMKMVGFITLLTPLISLGTSQLVTKMMKESSSQRYNNILASAILTISYILAIFILKDYLTLKLALRLFVAPLFIIVQYNLFAISDVRVSAWSAAMSALTTFLYLLSLHNIGGLTSPLFIAIMACGMVGSSRMYLSKDSGLSISLGYIIGIIAALISFYAPR